MSTSSMKLSARLESEFSEKTISLTELHQGTMWIDKHAAQKSNEHSSVELPRHLGIIDRKFAIRNLQPFLVIEINTLVHMNTNLTISLG